MQATISEAARRLGVPEKTVRRQVRNGELPGTQVATPQGYRWMVDLPDEGPQQEDNHKEHRDDDCVDLRAMVEILQTQVAADREELTAKNEQIRELHVLLQQTQAALPAPRDGRSWWRRVLGRG